MKYQTGGGPLGKEDGFETFEDHELNGRVGNEDQGWNQALVESLQSLIIIHCHQLL